MILIILIAKLKNHFKLSKGHLIFPYYYKVQVCISVDFSTITQAIVVCYPVH